MSNNIAHVYDNIYIGSLEAAININILNERNIKYVFNLSQIYINDHPEYQKSGIKIVNIMGVPDEVMPNYNLKKLAKVLSTYMPAIDMAHSHMPILINCRAGVNRSALTIGIYMKLKYKLDYANIKLLLSKANKTRNIRVLTNPTFRKLLKIEMNLT